VARMFELYSIYFVSLMQLTVYLGLSLNKKILLLLDY
jgi:hypothetical protein